MLVKMSENICTFSPLYANCCFSGLAIKRKSTATHAVSVAYSLNNIANLCCIMKNFSQANKLLEEAMQKLSEEDLPHKGVESLIYYTLGKVKLSQGNYQGATKLFDKAAAMYEIREDFETCMPTSKRQQKHGKYKIAAELSNKILRLSEAVNKAIQANTDVSETLELLIDAYIDMGESELVKYTLELLQCELIRQERIYTGSCNTRRVNEITTRLSDIQVSLKPSINTDSKNK